MRVKEKPFGHYNCRELGVKVTCSSLKTESQLAHSLLPEVDPMSRGDDQGDTVATFTEPKVSGGFLPNSLQYFHAIIPKPLPSGTSLATNQGGNYMRLGFDRAGKIQEVSYLGSPSTQVWNWLSLIGIHEKLLNNLFVRHSEDLAADLVTYLEAPWAVALFHDRFREFQEEAQEVLLMDPTVDQLRESLREMIRKPANPKGLSEADRETLYRSLSASLKEEVQSKLFEFLATNQRELPVYFVPEED